MHIGIHNTMIAIRSDFLRECQHVAVARDFSRFQRAPVTKMPNYVGTVYLNEL